MSRIDDLRGKNLLLQFFYGPRDTLDNLENCDWETCDILLQRAETVPMLPELENMVNKPDVPMRSEFTSGITLLLESAKAFHWQNDTFNKANCRIKALTLAKEVLDSVKDLCKTAEDKIMATAWDVSKLVPVAQNMPELLQTFARLPARFGPLLAN